LQQGAHSLPPEFGPLDQGCVGRLIEREQPHTLMLGAGRLTTYQRLNAIVVTINF
jgi:hypothetical protein